MPVGCLEFETAREHTVVVLSLDIIAFHFMLLLYYSHRRRVITMLCQTRSEGRSYVDSMKCHMWEVRRKEERMVGVIDFLYKCLGSNQ